MSITTTLTWYRLGDVQPYDNATVFICTWPHKTVQVAKLRPGYEPIDEEAMGAWDYFSDEAGVEAYADDLWAYAEPPKVG